MTFERIGFEAVIDKLQSYLNGARQITTANNAIIQSELNLQKVSIQASTAIEAADKRVAQSKSALAAATQSANASIVAAQVKQIQAQANVAAATNAGADAIAAAVEKNLAAQETLATVTEQSNRAIENSALRRALVEDGVADRIAAAFLKVEAAEKAVDASSEASEAKQASLLAAWEAAQEKLENTIIRGSRQVQIAYNLEATAVEQALGRITTASAALDASAASIDAAITKADKDIIAAEAGVVTAAQAVEAAEIEKAATITALEASVAEKAAAAATAQEVGSIRVAQAQLAAATAGSKLVQSTNAATGVFNTFKGAANKVEQAVNAFGRGLIAVTGFSNRFAVSLRFGIAAVTAFTAALTIGTASSYQDTLTKIDNLTDTTTEDTQKLGNQILELSKTLPQSPNELGATAYVVLSSGIKDVNEALQITTLSAEASAIGLGKSEDVAKTVTAILNAYGTANITAAQATDILVAGVKEGSAEASDYAIELGRLLGVAPALGIQFDQLAAGLATLTNVGLTASQATTALLDFMNQILSPSKEAEKVLASVGDSIQHLREEVRDKGLLPAFLEVLAEFGNNQDAIDTLIPSVRGLTGALGLLNDGGQKYTETLKNIDESAGITEQAFQRQSQNFSTQAKILRNELNIALIKLGSDVLPSVTSAVKDLSGWIDRNQEAIVSFGKAVATFITTSISELFRGLSTINNALSFIPENKLLIIGAISTIGAAMVAAWGPGSAAVIGLAGVITLLGQIADKSESTSRKIAGIGITAGLGAVGAGIGTAIEPGGGTLAGLGLGLGFGSIINNLVGGGKKGSQQGSQDALNKSLVDTGSITDQLAKTSLPQLNSQFSDTALSIGNVKTQADKLNEVLDFLFGQPTVEEIKNQISLLQAQQRIANFDASTAAQKTNLDIALKNAQDKLTQIQNQKTPTRSTGNDQTDAFIATRNARIQAEQEAAAQKNVDAVQKQIDAYTAQRDAIQKQIDAIQLVNDNYDRQNQLQKLQIQLSQANLLTEQQQNQIAQGIINGTETLQGVIDKFNLDAATTGAADLGNSTNLAASKVGGFTTSLDQAITDIQNSLKKFGGTDKGIINTSSLAGGGFNPTNPGGAFNPTNEQFNPATNPSSVPSFSKPPAGSGFSGNLLNDILSRHFDFNGFAGSLRTLQDLLGPTNTANLENFNKQVGGFNSLITAGHDPLDSLNTVLGGLSQADQAAKNLNDIFSALADFLSNAGGGFLPKLNIPTSAKARGGWTFGPTMTVLGEGNKPELTLPITDLARSRELLRSIPASLANELSRNPSSSTPGSVFGSLNVSGYIPAEVEAMVVTKVRQELSRTRANLRTRGL